MGSIRHACLVLALACGLEPTEIAVAQSRATPAQMGAEMAKILQPELNTWIGCVHTQTRILATASDDPPETVVKQAYAECRREQVAVRKAAVERNRTTLPNQVVFEVLFHEKPWLCDILEFRGFKGCVPAPGYSRR
jgi:hypothetical protein